MQKNIETMICTEVWDIQLCNHTPTYSAVKLISLIIVLFPSLFELRGLLEWVEAVIGCLCCPPNDWGQVEASVENDDQLKSQNHQKTGLCSLSLVLQVLF